MWRKVLAAACVVTVCPGCESSQAVESPLGERSGMSNRFFEPDDSRSVPAAWDSVEVAVLTQIAGWEVRLVRGRTEGGWVYRVADDGSGPVESDAPLWFIEAGGLLAAAVDLKARALEVPVLRFHVLTADCYVYGRPARSWRGQFRAGDHAVAVEVRPVFRMQPLPRDGLPFELLVDLDGDGELRERSVLQPGAGVAPSEVLRPDQPFRFGARAYRLESVDVDSSRLWIRPTSEAVAAAPGFLGPTVVTTILDGRLVSLEDLTGDVLVLEFWSTHCSFSEKIRQRILSLEEEVGPTVTWIAIAREPEADTVRAHLANHSIAGEPWAHYQRIWETCHPGTVTLLSHVIDRDGRIVSGEHGAGAPPLLASWLQALVNGTVDEGYPPGIGSRAATVRQAGFPAYCCYFHISRLA